MRQVQKVARKVTKNVNDNVKARLKVGMWVTSIIPGSKIKFGNFDKLYGCDVHANLRIRADEFPSMQQLIRLNKAGIRPVLNMTGSPVTIWCVTDPNVTKSAMDGINT